MRNRFRSGEVCAFNPPHIFQISSNLVKLLFTKETTNTVVRTGQHSRHAKIAKAILFKIGVVKTAERGCPPSNFCQTHVFIVLVFKLEKTEPTIHSPRPHVYGPTLRVVTRLYPGSGRKAGWMGAMCACHCIQGYLFAEMTVQYATQESQTRTNEPSER